MRLAKLANPMNRLEFVSGKSTGVNESGAGIFLALSDASIPGQASVPPSHTQPGLPS